jgi:hypothetical protein
MLRGSTAHGVKTGSGVRGGMRPRIHQKRIPIRPRRAESRGFRYDESRRRVQSQRFAKPIPLLGLRPKERRRATYANLRYLEAVPAKGYDDSAWDVSVKALPVSPTARAEG